MENQELDDLREQVKEVIHQCPFIEDYRGCSLLCISALCKEIDEHRALKLPNEDQLRNMLSGHSSCPLIKEYRCIVSKKLWCRLFL